jgi:hypothetical protein
VFDAILEHDTARLDSMADGAHAQRERPAGV